MPAMNPMRVLLVEDNPGDARLIRELLAEGGGGAWQFEHERGLTGGLARLDRGGVDVVLLDLSLPESRGSETLFRVRTHAHWVPIVVLTGQEDEDLGAQLVRAGAQDYLVKGQVSGPLLARALRYAVERVEAERLLLESQRNYLALFEAATDAILVAEGATGMIADANHQAQELLGRPLEELRKLHFTELHPPEERPRARDFFARVLRGGPLPFLAIQVLRRDGRRIPVEVSGGSPLASREGRQLMFGIFRDVSERRRVEAELGRRDALLELSGAFANRLLNEPELAPAILDCFRMLGQITGVDRVHLLENHRCPETGRLLTSQLYEWQAEDCPASPTQEALHDIALADRVPDWYQRLAHSDSVVAVSTGTDGPERALLDAYRVVSILLVPIFLEEAFWGILGLGDCRRDRSWTVSERRVLQSIAGNLGAAIVRHRKGQELVAAIEAAKAADHAKSRFVAHMSHEIRTPMNAVLGTVELLRDTPLNVAQRQYLDIINRCSESLLRVVTDILDFSKVETDGIALEEVDFDLRSLLEEAADLLAVRAQEKGLELTCRMAPEVPRQVRGDPMRLRQVLTHLAGNAIKFTQTGEVGVEVRVATRADTQVTLQFDVLDTGPGVSSGQLMQLFATGGPGQDDAAGAVGSGLGMGLTMAKQLTRLMGGRLGAQSELGKGSRFWFTVTLALPPAARATPQPLVAGFAGRRVLVIERNPRVRRTLTDFLRGWGCEVEEGASGQEGWATLVTAGANKPWAAVLLDSELPDVPAMELLLQLREHPALGQIPAVAVTPLGRGALAINPSELGITGVVTKPVKESQLYQRLACAFGLAAPPEVSPPGARSARPAGRRRERILIVEDNPTNQVVTQAMVERLGYTVDVAPNGLEALRAMAQADYDLILMDCQMPGMDGFETVRRIRDPGSAVRRHDLPIIAVTAHALKGDRERCLAVGMNDYLAKPVQPRDLGAAIERWLTHAPTPAAPVTARPPALALDAWLCDVEALLRQAEGDWPAAIGRFDQALEQLEEALEALEPAVLRADYPKAVALAAAASGAAAKASAPALRDAALQLEAALRAEQGTSADTLLRCLQREHERLKAVRPAMRQPAPPKSD